MTTDEFRIYLAGFFDGEGAVSIARQRANGLSDYHCIHVTLSQRAKHRSILDRVASVYGGHVNIRKQQSRIKQLWAEQAIWQLQHKAKISLFLLDMQPYCIVKERQIAIALEFLKTFVAAPNVFGALGRYQGKILSAEEIERRERLRLAMREANAFGPPKQRPSTLPPLDVRHREYVEKEPNRATISRGIHRPNARLTDDDVRAIRAEFAGGGVTKRALALKYGVTDMVIGGIVRRTRWAHVSDDPDVGSLPLPFSDQETDDDQEDARA